MRRVTGLAWAAGWALAGAFVAWWWPESYWRWRDCFNEEGRCFDPATATVHHAHTGVLIHLALACGAVALLGVAVAFWPPNRSQARPR